MNIKLKHDKYAPKKTKNGDTDSGAAIEIWRDSQNTGRKSFDNQSIQYSDVADELDYQYDQQYWKRVCSPQMRQSPSKKVKEKSSPKQQKLSPKKKEVK